MADGFEMTLMEAAQALGVELVGADHSFSGVSTDSRTTASGDLFVALTGPNFDGHEFIKTARERGAVAVMVSKRVDGTIPQLIVEDTRIGLGKLAAHWRSKFDIPVVGITGSNGKTTVKEMVRDILACRGEVLATKGNLNNDIGVPLTLFALRKKHDFAVIEMGANHPGEIAYLASLVKPDVGLVNNAGGAHLEGFGSLEGVAKAKGEMFQALSESGVAVINADDKFAKLWQGMASQCQAVHFAMDKPGVYTAELITEQNEFQLCTPEKKVSIKLPLLGVHNVMNALAASAVAISMGASLDDVQQGLQSLQAAPGRLEKKQGRHGSLVIDDTYNANPSSLKVGLDVLSANEGKKYLVIGDMGELGPDSEAMHADAGKDARAAGVDCLYATGELARKAADAFGEGGIYFEKQADLISTVRPLMDKDAVILVKGSRRMQMERVVASLIEEGGA